jgi:glycosyltransferase involved in cell wall biosynthesis
MISVCYIVDAPFLGGAELYVSRLASGLDRRRFRTRVLMPSEVADSRLHAWARDLQATGVDVDALPLRLPYHPLDAVGVWRWLDATSPDVVHVNLPGPYDGQMGLVLPLARAAGARTVVTEHLPMVERLWKRAWVKAVSYRHLDAAVTMTEANARYVVERQGVARERVHVIPNGVRRDYGVGVDPAHWTRERLGVPARSAVVCHVGNILVHKGLFTLIEALSRVGERLPWHLVVVGSGPDEGRCRSRVKALGLDARASFLGARSPREVESIVAACDVLVLASRIEGLPYTVLEAMACGIPVVAGRVYGLPEVVDDGVTGRLVDPENVDEIRRALEDLLADAELRARMGRAARERFEQKFTLDRQVRRMEALYEALARGRTRRGAAS